MIRLRCLLVDEIPVQLGFLSSLFFPSLSTSYFSSLSLSSLTMLRIGSRSVSHSRIRFNASTTRSYAQPINPTTTTSSSKSDSSNSKSNPRNWKSKPPLATAQTLTLFSDHPPSLLIALKSTMTGILTSAKRAGKSPDSVGTKEKDETKSHNHNHSHSDHDFILLFSISKDLPKDQLGEAVSLLRGFESEGSNSHSSIARIGTLSSSIPISLIPDSSLSSPLDPNKPLHSVSISLLPATNSIAFRSTIGGKPKVQIGRWPDKKDSWKRKDDRLEWLGNQQQQNEEEPGNQEKEKEGRRRE